MKKLIFIYLSFLGVISIGCSNGQSQSSKMALSPAEFSKKISEMPSSPIIDVRTPEEFSTGHLINANNIDWKGNTFNEQIAKIDKSTPVFVYCQAGARSAAAANKMRADGFPEVYELSGGFSKWRASNLPETTNLSPTDKQ